jgi:hypothetical protein
MAYVYANSLNPSVPRALDALTRAQAVFESFSSTCSTALSAKDIIQSLANSLQNMMTHGSCTVAAEDDPMDWGLFASLLEKQQTSSTGLENAPSSTDLYGSGLFSPFMPATSHINPPDFNPMTLQFGDS